MWRILILSSLSICFSVVLADSTCSNATSPMSPFLFADDILMKLQMELNSMKMSDEVQRLRLETISLRLEQISSKLGINTGCNVNSSSNVGGSSNVNANSSCSSTSQYPTSCDSVTTNSGTYTIQVPLFSAQPFLVYCNADVQGGGWTVIQRRVDDSVDFYRGWDDYKNGFGNLNGNFWIGNDKLHALTMAGRQELWIWLTDFDNVTKYAKYDAFAIGNESGSYDLKVLGTYSGDAGDSLTYHQGMKFTTKDKDNDVYSGNCAVLYKGGWWYKDCHGSNLNGLYLKGAYPESLFAQGIDWDIWHGHYYSLKTVIMMIRTKRN